MMNIQPHFGLRILVGTNLNDAITRRNQLRQQEGKVVVRRASGREDEMPAEIYAFRHSSADAFHYGVVSGEESQKALQKGLSTAKDQDAFLSSFFSVP